MQDLKVGEYYRISADEVNELIKEGEGEYSTGKFVKIADETGESNSDPAKNTYYLFEDVKSYTVNSTTPTEEEESELFDSEDGLVFKLLGTEENAKNEPFTIYAAWGALNSDETETALEDEDEDQTAPTTSSTTSSTSTTNNYEQQIQALEAHIAELQRQLNETQSLLRVPESERAALYAEMTSSSSNPEPEPEEDEPSKKPPQGGRKYKGKSVKRNRNKGRRVTYRLRRRA